MFAPRVTCLRVTSIESGPRSIPMKPTTRISRPTSAFVALAVCGLLALWSTSCSGSGSGGSGGSGVGAQDPAAADLRQVPELLAQDQQQHLLMRTSFGVNMNELAELQRVGLRAYVDQLLDFKTNTAAEQTAEKEFRNPESPRDYELVHWWIRLMVRTENPLQESLAFMWHDHFATSQVVLESGGKHLFKDHVQILRRAGGGNVRQLLHAIMQDAVLQIWLDGVSNTKEKPNENLAREFFELFALGVDNGYTQEDIQEAARALSGYQLITDNKTHKQFVVFAKGRHDAENKTIFGVTGNFGLVDLVNLTIQQRPVAEWISRRLFEHFCYPNAPKRVIDDLAGIMRANNYDLKPVIRTILLSRAFFSRTARQGRVKNPVEYFVGFVRTTGLEVEFDDMSERLASLAQQPTRPPNVGGWPVGTEWLGPQELLERGNSVNESITSRDHQFKLGFGLNEIMPPKGQRTAEHVVDRFAIMLRINMSTSEHDKYIDYLNTNVLSSSGNTFKTEVDEFDATKGRHMDERVRGLLFIMSQHPSYYLR